MINIKKKIFTIILLFLIIFFFPTSNISKYLSITKKTNANILLLEGWVPDYILKEAYQEFTINKYDYIITTGLKAPDYYPVVMNGLLVFNTKNLLLQKEKLTHKIELQAFSEMGGKHRAHCNFYINDSLAESFYVKKNKSKKEILWFGKLADIDSITINFDNDSMGVFGDHNLYIKQIIINDTLLIPYMNNSVYNRTESGWEKKIPLDYTSFAGIARNKLIDLGINKQKIISIPSQNHSINRTLSSVISFKEWLKSNKKNIKGINIVSMGPHARRTWITYKKVLNEDFEIGIISITQPKNNRRDVWLKNIDSFVELIKLIYYVVVLLIY